MTAEEFKSWLEAYGRAWMDRDAKAAADLFAQGGTYQVTPFEEPMHGRDAIYGYWRGITETEENIRFDFEILAADAEVGIAHWWASFVRIPPGSETRLDGIFLISLGPDGRCKSLREWWVKKQPEPTEG